LSCVVFLASVVFLQPSAIFRRKQKRHGQIAAATGGPTYAISHLCLHLL